MEELLNLFNKYINEEYGIEDVSRILSYISIPELTDYELENAEYQIERIRFLSSDTEQKKRVQEILLELIEKGKMKI